MTNKYANPKGVMKAIRNAEQFLVPPPDYTPVEWAEANIKIPLGNAIPGPLRFSNTPHLIEPFNVMADPKVKRITLMFGAQLGKTTMINAAIGYHIAHDPVSQMMMQPSQGDLHTWLETKFNPMVEANEPLKDRIAKPRSREGVNNQAMKSYPGGFLMFSWSGSPRTMRGRSAPKIYCDEVDGYDYTAEGHPVNLLWQRAATFGDQRKLVVTSTPTIKGASFVESSFEEGDQRRFYMPCFHCDEDILFEWKNVHWEKDGDTHLPDTAVYVCPECGAIITDAHKKAMLRKGHWVAAKPFRGHASYHCNELYSTFRKFSDVAQSFLEKKAMNDVQTFVNVSLAETWEETGEQADPNALPNFAENYDRDTRDENIVFVTAGCDVQKDRIEAQVVGWAYGGVPYIISHDVFYGNPVESAVWNDLDQYLLGTFSGLRITQTYIDSGYLTEFVYTFTKKRHGRKVFPVKGDAGVKDVVSKPTQSGAQRAMLVKVGIDPVKRTLLTLLKDPGEKIHFSHKLDGEFYKQLTAEKMIIRKVKGFDRMEFVKTRDRNEALDCFVYAYAAMVALQPNWKKLAEPPKTVEEETFTVPEPAKRVKKLTPPKNRRLRTGGFATKW